MCTVLASNVHGLLNCIKTQHLPLEVMTKKTQFSVCACQWLGSSVIAEYQYTWCYTIYKGASMEPN